MQRIRAALEEVFPEFDAKTFGPGLALGQIENYDSMNAVTLVMNLEGRFGVALDIETFPLDRTNTVADIAAHLEGRGVRLDS